MTTRTEAKNILIKEFKSSYQLSYPVAYVNNANFNKPTDAPWISFAVKNNKSTQTGFGKTGDRTFERLGIISYQVFIPANSGTYDGDTICDYINTIFEGNRYNDIYCEAGYWSESGVTGDDWFQFNGRIFFNFDENK